MQTLRVLRIRGVGLLISSSENAIQEKFAELLFPGSWVNKPLEIA